MQCVPVCVVGDMAKQTKTPNNSNNKNQKRFKEICLKKYFPSVKKKGACFFFGGGEASQ